MRPRSVAFDWGGVFTVGTFDSSAVVALARLLGVPERELGPAYLRAMEGFEAGETDMAGFHRSLLDAVARERIGATVGGSVPEPAPEGAPSSPSLEAFRSAFLGAVVRRPAAYRLVAALPDDVTVGVLSNNVPELCDIVRRDPRLGRVEAFVFSNEIGVRKPDRRAYEALLAALDRRPEEVVFVDDNAANVAAADDLGIVAVLLDADFPARWAARVPEIPLPSDLATASWTASRPA